MTVLSKRTNPVDIHIGSRVRLKRQMLQMSQEKLGEYLGVTFQQVQKYEKGSNRIGAGSLWRIAQIMGTPVSFFFEGLRDKEMQQGFAESQDDAIVYEFINSSDGVALIKAFAHVKDPRVRRRILELVRTLAGSAEER